MSENYDFVNDDLFESFNDQELSPDMVGMMDVLANEDPDIFADIASKVGIDVEGYEHYTDALHDVASAIIEQGVAL